MLRRNRDLCMDVYSVGRLSLLSSSLQLLLPPLRSFLLVLQSFQQKLELVQLQFLLLLSSFVHHFLLNVLFQHRHFYDHFLPHFQLFLQQLCNRRPCEHHFLLRSSLQLYHFQYARQFLPSFLRLFLLQPLEFPPWWFPQQRDCNLKEHIIT